HAVRISGVEIADVFRRQRHGREGNAMVLDLVGRGCTRCAFAAVPAEPDAAAVRQRVLQRYCEPAGTYYRRDGDTIRYDDESHAAPLPGRPIRSQCLRTISTPP